MLRAPSRVRTVRRGFFVDAAHHVRGTWKGVRVITDAYGTTPVNSLTLLGSDDGDSWWMLHGTIDRSTGAIKIDFSPKGGPCAPAAFETGGGAKGAR
jgi:hypothetical protein